MTLLDVPYVNTSAAELVWTLDHERIPALTRRTFALADEDIELRVLGASHQVVLRRDDDELIETVACLRGTTPHLPASAIRRRHGRKYTFESRVFDVAPDELPDRVTELRAFAERDGGLLAEFPAEPNAVTALRLDCDKFGVRWRTWHVYPRSTQIVQTSTEVLLDDHVRR